MKPLYHHLDPLWSRVPAPARAVLERETIAGLTALRMERVWFGRELLSVYCFAVGDTLVDTGLPCAKRRLLDFAKGAGIRRALVTHHHEDHAGNAGALARAGLEVLTSDTGTQILSKDLPIRFYQHVLWGKAEAAPATALPERIALGPWEAHVIPAAGHAVDQVAFHVPSQGMLFTGDAFVAERIKVFRRDEDFAETVATLERFLALDFDVLLCAHRPREKDGQAAIRAKRDWMKEIEGRVNDLRAKGAGVPEIVARLPIRTTNAFYKLTFGDVSTANMVRSILGERFVRPELLGIPKGSPGSPRLPCGL